MKKIIIVHHDDHDGIVGAGIIIKKFSDELRIKDTSALKSIIKTIAIDYNMKIEDLITKEEAFNSVLYFVDYSFSDKENIEWLRKVRYGFNLNIGNKDIYWFDHHKTSIDLCTKYDDHEMEFINGFRAPFACGALLTYLWITRFPEVINKYVREDYDCDTEIWLNETDINNFNDQWEYYKYNCSKFIILIDDYDRWAKLYKETNAFHYGVNLSSDPFDHKLLLGYLNVKPTDKIEISNIDRSQREARNILVDEAIKRGNIYMEIQANEDKEFHIDMYSFEVEIQHHEKTYRCLVLNRKCNSITFGDKIKEYDIVCPFYFNGEVFIYSLFTEKDDIDCEAIAKSFGGGGHKKAAGFISNDIVFSKKKS